MITKKTLKDYKLKEIKGYFNIIVESWFYGQFSGKMEQAKEQFSALSHKQRKEFIKWLEIKEYVHHSDINKYAKISLINYFFDLL